MEFAKIVLLAIAAAICYGIVHDQVTARICLEYFTVFHPPVFHTDNPTLLGLGWGVIATWWMGAFLGVFLAIAARAGRKPKVAASDLVRPVIQLLSAMALIALLAGTAGYLLARTGVFGSPSIMWGFQRCSYNAFVADWWAHSASYGAAALGGTVLCLMTYRKRVRAQWNVVNPSAGGPIGLEN
jgi:hypothetical protein